MKGASPRSGDEVANGFQKKIAYSSRNASISSLVSKEQLLSKAVAATVLH